MAWAPDYIEAATLKGVIGIDDTIDDTAIGLAITAASRVIDQFCGRQFGQVAAVQDRTYDVEWDGFGLVVAIDDLMTDTGLLVDGVTTTELLPRNAPQNDRPWTQLSVSGGVARGDAVVVTAQWGWTIVPVTVQQATLTQALRILKRKDAPFGVAGSPQDGSEVRLLAKVDPDVAVALAPYRRIRRLA